MLRSSKPEAVHRFDDPRPFFPGEHYVDLALGVTAWWFTRKNPSLAIRTLGTFIAATLVARGAHGRPLPTHLLRWTPLGGGIKHD